MSFSRPTHIVRNPSRNQLDDATYAAVVNEIVHPFYAEPLTDSTGELVLSVNGDVLMNTTRVERL